MSEASTARARRGTWITLACLAAAVLIMAASWMLAPRPSGEGEESFGGTDSKVSTMLEEDGAQPWFQPLFEPGSGEIESGLFALQAALGAGIFGYAVGRLHGRRRTLAELAGPADASPTPGAPETQTA